MPPALTPQQFSTAWANVHLKESASYVTHFDDLCALVGHLKPAHMDKTFETFPFPWPPGQEPSKTSRGSETREVSQERAIAQAAKELVELRDSWLNPYKDQPAGIDEILARLLALNLQRTAQS